MYILKYLNINIFKSAVKDKKILITGHTGVIGANFIKQFPDNNYVKCRIDIRNKKKVFSWIKKNNFDLFIHLAAIVSVKNVEKNLKDSFDVNFVGTKNIVDAFIKFKKKKIFGSFILQHLMSMDQEKILHHLKKPTKQNL